VLVMVGVIGVAAAVVGTLFGLGVFSGEAVSEAPKQQVAVIDAPAEVTRSTGIRSFRFQGLSQDAAATPTVTKLTPDMLIAPIHADLLRFGDLLALITGGKDISSHVLRS